MGASEWVRPTDGQRERVFRPWACKELLIAAAARVRAVLLPQLGPTLAAERANNIAQALAFDATQVEAVAHEMLRDIPLPKRRIVARQVSLAWLRPRD